MKKNNIKKRAELTTQQIIIIVVLIASFTILLFFLYKLNLPELSKKEICHNSVIQQTSFVNEAFKGSLDCKIEFVCISSGGDCEGRNFDRTIEVKLTDDLYKNQNEIFNTLAEEMADCWWMFGEGKIDYSGPNFLKDKDGFCAICSIIKFDSNIQNKFLEQEIKYDEFASYLATTKMNEEKTYFNYLNSSEENYNQLQRIESFSFDKEYIIITGIGESPSSFFSGNNFKSIPVLFLENEEDSYEAINCKGFATNY